MVWATCDSTRPPISSTRVEIPLSSTSNWLDKCFSVVGYPSELFCACFETGETPYRSAEATGDVVFRFRAFGLHENIGGLTEFNQFAQIHVSGVVRTAPLVACCGSRSTRCNSFLSS